LCARIRVDIVGRDEVDVEVRGHGCVDGVEDLPELVVMAAVTASDDLARRDVQRGEPRGGLMVGVFVRPTLDLLGSHGQRDRGERFRRTSDSRA